MLFNGRALIFTFSGTQVRNAEIERLQYHSTSNFVKPDRTSSNQGGQSDSNRAAYTRVRSIHRLCINFESDISTPSTSLRVPCQCSIAPETHRKCHLEFGASNCGEVR